MRTTTAEYLSELQKNPKNIRNICILAHVDHGKTTLADALVASNGIISSRLVGKLRYMDSREDEQIRGITMKSSAISLHYSKDGDEFLINLIDSPGHVDFSSEVSTAVRLCDGAVVVVDVVEGVSPQTHVVLRQAWLENIRPCLVLNKIDRLITELKYSPVEAHTHLQQILEQVNAITGTLFSSEVMEKSSTKTIADKPKDKQVIDDDSAVAIEDWSSGLAEIDDSSLYFSPDLGNVVFASAIDGWGFSIDDFATLYSKKLGLKEDILRQTLWGDYYLDAKTKRIFKKAQAKGKKPLFVQFILQNIWSVYEAVILRRDKIKSEQIAKSLNLKISTRDSRHADPRVHLYSICSQWLPLSRALLSMMVDKLPSPLEMAGERVETLMCSGLRTFDSLPQETKQLKQDFLACRSGEDAPVIVFVSKMFAVDDHALPKHRRRPLTQDELAQRRQQARQKHAQMMAENRIEKDTSIGPDSTRTSSMTNDTSNNDEDQASPTTHFMAFARVYSGTIRKGQHLYVLGPKHDPRNLMEEHVASLSDEDDDDNGRKRNEGLSVARSVDRGTDQHVAVFTVDDLYLLMGRELESLKSVPAGNVLGIGGLQDRVLKSATIASTVACPPFTALPIEARPIVRVAIEPVHAADMPALARGMRLLNQADPCVETFVQGTGEHVIIAAGEVHLQRCVDDLKERYACVQLNVSAPIIPFRETIVLPPTVDMVNEVIIGESSGQQVKQMFSELESDDDTSKIPSIKNKLLVEIKTANKQCTIHIRATPLPQQAVQLLDKNTELIKLLTSGPGTTGSDKKQPSQLKGSTREQIQEFYNELGNVFHEAGSDWEEVVDRIWAFGPRRTGPNILLNRIPDYKRPSIWQGVNKQDTKTSDSQYRSYDNSIVSGFQLATLAGPLCEEPLMGVCFVIENLVMNEHQTGKTGSVDDKTDLKTIPTSLENYCVRLHLKGEESVMNSEISHKKVQPLSEKPGLSDMLVSSNEQVESEDEKRFPSKESTGLSSSSFKGDSGHCKFNILMDDKAVNEVKVDDLLKENSEESQQKTVGDEPLKYGADNSLNTETVKTSIKKTEEITKIVKTSLESDSVDGEFDGISERRNFAGELRENQDCLRTGQVDKEKEHLPKQLPLSKELTEISVVLDAGEKYETGQYQKEDQTETREREKCSESKNKSRQQVNRLDRWGPFSGQIMSAVKEGCRRAFQLQPMRLMAAMYTCHIQATSDVLGRMYAVIAKRMGRVLSEEMKEGSDVFDVEAVLPVAESFGFAEDIRKRTSGVANPQLVFSHWEVVDMDPFWVPTTEEEYTHFGEKADSDNQACKYMNSVRRRKGLYVDEKTVEHAEKQRTLKK